VRPADKARHQWKRTRRDRSLLNIGGLLAIVNNKPRSTTYCSNNFVQSEPCDGKRKPSDRVTTRTPRLTQSVLRPHLNRNP